MTPAVLIPGTLCDSRVFGLLKLDLEMLVVDPLDTPTVEEAAEAVLAKAPRYFTVAGFSLGGFVALEILRQAPDRLQGVVMIASNPYALASDQVDARHADVALVRSEGVEALIDRLWSRYVAPAAAKNAQLRSTIVDMAIAVGVERFASQTEIAISRPDRRDLVRASRVPILWLHGREDAMNARGHGREIGDGDCEQSICFDGVGHFIPLEAPCRASDAINAWARERALCC